MSYLRNVGKTLKIENNIYTVIFTLELIDELQDRTNMSITELIFSMTEDKTREVAVKCIIKYLLGVDVNDKFEYYSIFLLNTYIEQLKYKDMPEPKKTTEDGEYEFINVEYWYYIGTVQLKRSSDEVWSMTLGQIRTLFNEHLKYQGLIKEDKEVSIDEAIPL